MLLILAASRAELVAPDPTLLLLDRGGRFLGEVGPDPDDPEATFGYWPVEELPERVVAATLAVEDRRFWSHPGVDSLSVLRAALQNLIHGERISGASTIPMQVARMQRDGPRTYPRKAVESTAALMLTARYGREAVLRHYLRIVPYGNRIHGIGYAARRYLDKPVEDLSWAEVAFLTSIPQSPATMNPFSPRGRLRAIARGERILDLLLDEGAMSAEEHELARRQIRKLHIPPKGRRPESALHAVLELGERLKKDPPPRGLVTTTLDLDLQEEVAWQVLRAVDGWEARGAGNAAAAVIDRQTHEVLAWVGSAGYFDSRRAGAIDYGRVARSPGSALKPFFYALGLDRGTITPASLMDDLERGAGTIGNADGRFLGPMLPRAALGNSRNVPAVNLLAKMSLHDAFGLLGDLGLHDGHQSAARYGFGIAIGTLPVTLERLLTAYTALAGDGRVQELSWFLGREAAKPRGVLSEDAARLVTLFLADPQARLPSFERMGRTEYPFPVAIKTGTSSQYRDAWAVAYSSRYLVGAWVGHPDHRSMNRLSGYTSASQLVREILVPLHRDQLDGLEDVSFPPPRGYVAGRLCTLTGRRATPACDRVSLEWFRPGRAPPDPCDAHVRVAVDRRDGLRATARTPPAEVEVRTFVELPARYAAWAAEAGLPRPPREWSALAPDERGPLRRPRIAAAVHRTPRLSVAAPQEGLRLLLDPETPAGLATLALKAVVDPPVEQVVWYVDGAPFQVADYPYTARWPLRSGVHSFQVRLPYRDGASNVVQVRIE